MRAVLRPNLLLLVHHVLWVILIVIASAGRSVFAIKLDLLLDWMVCWEAALVRPWCCMPATEHVLLSQCLLSKCVPNKRC